MKTLFLCLSISLGAFSFQQSAPAQPASVASTELHKTAVELVELSGARQAILSQIDNILASGKQGMLQRSQDLDPAFVEEWAKRMKARFNADDYVAVMVRVYEAHFSVTELKELIQAQRDAKESKAPTLSPELKAKLSANGTTVQSEIMGGCAQIGAKLGGDIALEIGKEHPEWTHAPAPASPKD